MQEIKTKRTQPSWHNICIDSVLEKLGATSAGLTRHEAETRLRTHGTNQLPDPPKRGAIMRFLLQSPYPDLCAARLCDHYDSGTG